MPHKTHKTYQAKVMERFSNKFKGFSKGFSAKDSARLKGYLSPLGLTEEQTGNILKAAYEAACQLRALSAFNDSQPQRKQLRPALEARKKVLTKSASTLLAELEKTLHSQELADITISRALDSEMHQILTQLNTFTKSLSAIKLGATKAKSRGDRDAILLHFLDTLQRTTGKPVNGSGKSPFANSLGLVLELGQQNLTTITPLIKHLIVSKK